MDLQSTSLLPILVVTLAFSLFIYSLSCNRLRGVIRKAPPQVGGAWPIIGHIHLFSGSSKPLHVALGELADKYGPIFTIKFGVKRTLVVSNSEMAKEVLKTNDKAFASRAKTLASEILGYNSAYFVLSPYGYYLRQVRKMAMLQLFSSHRVETLKHIRESEVNGSIRELFERWTKNKKVAVDISEWFGDISENVIFRMILGQRFTQASNYVDNSKGGLMGRKIFHDFIGMLATFVVADAIPFMRWLDLGGHEKAMKKMAKEVDHILEGWLEEHKQKKRISGHRNGGDGDNEGDFMDAMLSILDGARVAKEYDADTINKATALTILLAGLDVTTVTLTWALSLLLNNPNSLKKVQQELDHNIGRDRLVQDSDIEKLTYLEAVMKETLRLYPPGTLAVPHESTQDCVVGGYHVPAKTRLLVNIAKIQRDPKTWPDPDVFRPERFFTMEKKIDVKGQDFELIPFGSGRRMCPGTSLALRLMQLSLASLLHGFEIGTVGDEPVDMSETFELTNHKASLLQVVVTPRLAAHLYEHEGYDDNK